MSAKLYIITITKNDFLGLKLTLNSIAPFLNDLAGHVLVNGGECGNSDELINDYVNKSDKVIVLKGPDKGIYDAMTKGASLIADDSAYIWYVNSGDSVLHLPNICNHYSSYFFGVLISETERKASAHVLGDLTAKSFFPGSIYWHQGFVIRSGALKMIGFGGARFRGDLYQMSMAHRYLDYKVVHDYPCRYSISGISNSARISLLVEYFQVANSVGYSFFTILLNHPLFVLTFLFRYGFSWFSKVGKFVSRVLSRKISAK